MTKFADQDVPDSFAAIDAARNCGMYGPVPAMNGDTAEAVMLIQEVAAKARTTDGIERPIVVPTQVACSIAKELEDLFWRRFFARVETQAAQRQPPPDAGSYGGGNFGDGGYLGDTAAA